MITRGATVKNRSQMGHLVSSDTSGTLLAATGSRIGSASWLSRLDITSAPSLARVQAAPDHVVRSPFIRQATGPEVGTQCSRAEHERGLASSKPERSGFDPEFTRAGIQGAGARQRPEESTSRRR